MSSWQELKDRLLADVDALEPVTKVNSGGVVSVEIANSEEYDKILSAYAADVKKRAKRSELTTILTILVVFGLAIVLAMLFPDAELPDKISAARIPIVIVVLAIPVVIQRRIREAESVKMSLSAELAKVYQKKYERGEYHSVDEDGIVNFGRYQISAGAIRDYAPSAGERDASPSASGRSEGDAR